MERFLSFCRKNKWAVILAAVGLVLMILFFAIGFFRTILILAVVALCFFIGYLLDQGGVDAVKNFFKNIFSKDKNA